MLDGHVNKCIVYNKNDVRARENLLKEDKVWHEKEKERHRNKYYRLGYKEKHKPSKEVQSIIMQKYRNRYPEKYKAAYINRNRKNKAVIKGNHLHHWCYKEDFACDTIELTPKQHMCIHRYIKYNKEYMIYEDLEGNLLDSKDKHLSYINSLSN